jgi:polysaccharide deacetylase family protein (PEP-CTERM system associated)
MSDRVTNALCIDADDLADAFVEAGHRLRNPELCVAAETESLLAELDQLGLKATFFVPGAFLRVAARLVRTLSEAGHEIASHGFRHTHIWKLSRSQFGEDLRRSKQTLEDLSGHSVDTYKAPIWSISRRCRWAYDVLVEEGFRVDHSATPRVKAEMGWPTDALEPFMYSGSLLVVPTTTVELLGVALPFQGGFFNARVPFPLLRFVYDQINARGLPFNVYFHPFEHSPSPRNRRWVKYGSPFVSLCASHVGRSRILLPKLASSYRLGTLRQAYARWHVDLH